MKAIVGTLSLAILSLQASQAAYEINHIYQNLRLKARLMIYDYREAYGCIDNEIKDRVRKYLILNEWGPIARRVLEELEEEDFQIR